MKIAVTGGDGRLALELKKLAPNWIYLSRDQCDITDITNVYRCIKDIKPDVILHTAAMTNPMQLHEERPELSIASNIIGTAHIAAAAHTFKSKLVYISTDYIYLGEEGPHFEHGETAGGAETTYGKTKYGGEISIRCLDNFMILRAAIVPKPFKHLHALCDIKKSPIFIDRGAATIKHLIEADYIGILNLGGPRVESLYNFAKRTGHKVKKITRDKLMEKVNYYIPYDTSLDSNLLQIALGKEYDRLILDSES